MIHFPALTERRLERRTTEYTSSRRIMRLVFVFILETHNQTNDECLPKFVLTDYASSSIKTAIVTKLGRNLLVKDVYMDDLIEESNLVSRCFVFRENIW